MGITLFSLNPKHILHFDMYSVDVLDKGTIDLYIGGVAVCGTIDLYIGCVPLLIYI